MLKDYARELLEFTRLELLSDRVGRSVAIGCNARDGCSRAFVRFSSSRFAGKAISDGKWVSGEAVEEGPMVWGMHRGSGLVQVGSLAKSVGLNGFGMSLNSGFAMTALAGRICRVWQATGSAKA